VQPLAIGRSLDTTGSLLRYAQDNCIEDNIPKRVILSAAKNPGEIQLSGQGFV
jgi:hypothetical protein